MSIKHDKSIDLNGTSLQGYLEAPMSKLVEVFGEPETNVDGYKVAFEWKLKFPGGTIASIYDYKSSNLYDTDNPSPEQMRKDDFSDWHIGGHVKHVVELVQTAIACADMRLAA